MDRDRGRRRRKRGRGKYDGGYRGDYHRDYDSKEDREDHQQPPMPTKTPIILAKPDRSQGSSSPRPLSISPPKSELGVASSQSDISIASNKPIIIARPKDSSVSSSTSSGVTSSGQTTNIPGMLAGDAIPGRMYVAQRPDGKQQKEKVVGINQIKLSAPSAMPQPIKLMDENFMWRDQALDVLLEDQSDYFVIGVLGLQGSGKSTIMSNLACMEQHWKDYKFKTQTYEILENRLHQTEGIDMYVTNERMILLDTQPVLSGSVLDKMIDVDRKYPSDYTSMENFAEIQSLQLAAFLMTVCHTVIVCMDWFADLNFLKLILTAEMLKPATRGTQETTGEEHEEYHPHISFILNKAQRGDFTWANYNEMQSYLKNLFSHSSLKLKDTLHMATGDLVPGLNSKMVKDKINLFLLPETYPRRKQGTDVFSTLPQYHGHPPFEEVMLSLRNRLFSLPRNNITHTTLSEKNWFHYSARIWDSVRKSPLLAEYNRLLN